MKNYADILKQALNNNEKEGLEKFLKMMLTLKQQIFLRSKWESEKED